MNYIYDVVLNFQDNYYNFFEWNKSDKIKNISRIPIYRVDDQDILTLKYNDVKLANIDQIKDESDHHKKIICLVSNTKIALGLLFSQEGTLLKRSGLIFEEESEVNTFAISLPITSLEYLENINHPPQDKLRLEIEKKDTLVKSIQTISDPLTLKYLYYEYYEEECQNLKLIKDLLLQELEKPWTKKQNNLYNVVKLLNKNNLPTK